MKSKKVPGQNFNLLVRQSKRSIDSDQILKTISFTKKTIEFLKDNSDAHLL